MASYALGGNALSGQNLLLEGLHAGDSMLIPANLRKRADFERVRQFSYIPPLAGIRPRQDQTRPRNAGGFRKVVHERYLASIEIGTNLDVTAR